MDKCLQCSVINDQKQGYFWNFYCLCLCSKTNTNLFIEHKGVDQDRELCSSSRIYVMWVRMKPTGISLTPIWKRQIKKIKEHLELTVTTSQLEARPNIQEHLDSKSTGKKIQRLLQPGPGTLWEALEKENTRQMNTTVVSWKTVTGKKKLKVKMWCWHRP